MVAGGGPAATNLGRLANGVSTTLGFRAPGSVTGPDSPRPYLSGGVDADLRAAAAQLGVDDDLFGPGSGDYDTSAVTAGGLRNVGQTLGRQVSLPPCVRFLVSWSGKQLTYGGVIAEDIVVCAMCYLRAEWTS